MDLDEQLRGKKYEQIPLRVTAGVLLHIGAGIYNSVAGALKELVSNAYDADATRAVISTGYPDFSEFRVVDNGAGMTEGQFTMAMRSIGSSLKAITHRTRLTSVYHRPVIGHLGIGLMALTQVCERATIESQTEGSNTKFVAVLDFSELHKRAGRHLANAKLDVLRHTGSAAHGRGTGPRPRNTESISSETVETLAQDAIVEKANEVWRQSGEDDLEGEQLGYCVIYPNLPAVQGRHGTSITLTNVTPGVRSALVDQGRPAVGTDADPEDYWNARRDELRGCGWPMLCRRLSLKTGGLNFQSLPKYHQFLWELSVMTPVPYLPDAFGQVCHDLVSEKRRELERFNFELIVDNEPLHKPVILPAGDVARLPSLEPGFDFHVQSVNFDDTIDEEELRLRGYLYWQRNQVEPSTLRGVQVYIRNVGIGMFDQTLMGFSNANPTSRAGQICGELYAEEGLERALNVDRNSFRETDAHYAAVQEHVWQLLGSPARGKGIFGTSVDAYWKRKARLDATAQEEHVAALANAVSRVTAGSIHIRFSGGESDEPFEMNGRILTVHDASPAWPRSLKERRTYQQLLIPLVAAASSGATASDILALIENDILA